ncbi:G-protein alpha subunit-domain-containing protein [Obelidium mucronatum]|nr:G-protein alpha subunit-domain-containing protein [Obelidium mucronatum]
MSRSRISLGSIQEQPNFDHEAMPILNHVLLNEQKAMATSRAGMLTVEDAVKILQSEATFRQFSHGFKVSSEVAAAVRIFWDDLGVQYCYSQCSDDQLDSCSYLFSHVQRITSPGYLPTSTDMIHAYIRGPSNSQPELFINQTRVEVLDIVGQKGNCKKLLHLFEDVGVIVFVAALGSYDQVLQGDGGGTTKLLLAIELFGKICNHAALANASTVLFLNKVDLFKQKINVRSIKMYLPEYEGVPNSYDDTRDFIVKKFLEQVPSRKVDVHLIQATDVENMKVVLESVVSAALTRSLKAVALV